MTPEDLIKEIERYRDELTQIMKRFTHSGSGMFAGFHMNREDDPRLRTIVIELIDLLNDSIPDNQYSTVIQNTYNGGYSQFFLSYSYKCVEDIVSTLDSIITRLKRNPDICNPKQDNSSSSEKPPERQNMIKPIEDLTELERRIIRHHILTYSHYTNGLSTLGIFNDVHQDESDAAVSKLVQYGYYNKPQHHSVSWTPDGYHRCRNYFKDEINNAHRMLEWWEELIVSRII